ncbi:hypothetical protein HYV71_02870 [Candidatus Uhrbacteria bacterium]|nr:hypothetical protein [Candidatus Uhrbacteria bacterium]
MNSIEISDFRKPRIEKGEDTMSHKARKLLTQDTLIQLGELSQLIPSKSILVVVGPETVEPWDLSEDPQYEDLWVRDLDARRTIGGEAQRQIDYAKWGWLESSFRRPTAVVIPYTQYAIQTSERLEFSGIIKMICVRELCAFVHNGGLDDKYCREVWGESRVSILARHLGTPRSVNGKTTFQWYLQDAVPALLKCLAEFEAFDRFELEQPLTIILPPVYAQLFAWAFAEMIRRNQKRFFGGVADIINQPFYGCDAILVTLQGVSIMRSGWQSSRQSRMRIR